MKSPLIREDSSHQSYSQNYYHSYVPAPVTATQPNRHSRRAVGRHPCCTGVSFVVCGRSSTGFAGHSGAGTRWLGKAKTTRRNRRGTVSLSSWGLRDRDLPQHACRLYFSGTNIFGRPFKLSPVPPPALEPFVLRGPFSDFVEVLNHAAAWPLLGWEMAVYALLFVLCYPLARVFLQVWARGAGLGVAVDRDVDMTMIWIGTWVSVGGW